jgi:hypothetical protein
MLNEPEMFQPFCAIVPDAFVCRPDTDDVAVTCQLPAIFRFDGEVAVCCVEVGPPPHPRQVQSNRIEIVPGTPIEICRMIFYRRILITDSEIGDCRNLSLCCWLSQEDVLASDDVAE